MIELTLSAEADDRWAFILEHDRLLAERIDTVLGQIESDDPGLRWQRYHNGARFVAIELPGRDEQYTVIWTVADQAARVVWVGAVT